MYILIVVWTFYIAQARLDGPFCDYTLEQKMQYLRDAYDAGVKNFEMEGLWIGLCLGCLSVVVYFNYKVFFYFDWRS